MSSAVDQLKARYAQVWHWEPPPELVARAKATWRRHSRQPWPGFRPLDRVPQPFHGEPWAETLLAAYAEVDQFNEDHFGGLCPPVIIVVNTRLRSIGARIFPSTRLMELNPRRLEQLPDSRTEIVFHELIHLWLHTQGLPSGHGPEFRAKMRERGHTSTRLKERHEYPGSDRRVVYRCSGCQREILVRRRYSRAMACKLCWDAGRGNCPIVEVGVRWL